MTGEAPSYPTEWEFDAVLADGGTVHIRPVRPADAEEVRDFHERQSPESIYFRFFSPRPRLSDRDVERLVNVDHAQRMALVAWLGERIVGMAGYDIWRARTEADVWFLVDDDERGRGLATILLEYLAEGARQNGLTGLTAQVLPSNQRMLAVFRAAGFDASSSFEDGVIEVRFGIEPTPATRDRIAERERAAEARSVERLLRPATVAVIGAGRRQDSVGHVIFRNLIEGGFTGTAYPVNPAGEPVAGVRSYPSISDVPEVVDVAVVAVPAPRVLDVVEACGHRRVGGLIVVSAGFQAFGPDARTGERLIVERARLFGMRVIGPESLGAINTDPAIALHASVARTAVRPGPVAYLAQSGTLGIAALEHARRVGLGFSTFVDVGSKVDVSGNDLLQFWEQDPATEVIALHLESFGNPRKFTRLARRIARHKPIVAVRTRRELGPTQWAEPDAGAPVGGVAVEWPEQATVDAMLEQSGVIRADTPTELFDIARVLAQQGPVRGARVAVISNSTGASNLTGDALRLSELTIAPLSTETRRRLSEIVPGSVTGPIDLTFTARPEHYRAALAAVLADDGVDACIVIHAPAIAADTEAVAAALVEAVAGAPPDRPPVVAILLGREVGEPVQGDGVAIPVFEFPAEAVRALGRLSGYQRWLARAATDEGPEPDPEGVDAVRSIVDAVLEDAPDGRWLRRDEGDALLAACGMWVLRDASVDDEAAAVEAAAGIGYPVVLKAAVARPRPGPAGGVALGIHDEAQLREVWAEMAELHGDAMRPAVVQQMAAPGPEVRVAGHQHAGYGGVIGLALGGPVSAADTSLPVRVLPAGAADLADLLERSPVHHLVEAMEDPEGGRRSLLDVLTRVARLLDVVPELHALRIDSGFVSPAGVAVAEARVLVAPDRWDPLDRVRRLD